MKEVFIDYLSVCPEEHDRQGYLHWPPIRDQKSKISSHEVFACCLNQLVDRYSKAWFWHVDTWYKYRNKYVDQWYHPYICLSYCDISCPFRLSCQIMSYHLVHLITKKDIRYVIYQRHCSDCCVIGCFKENTVRRHRHATFQFWSYWSGTVAELADLGRRMLLNCTYV